MSYLIFSTLNFIVIFIIWKILEDFFLKHLKIKPSISSLIIIPLISVSTSKSTNVGLNHSSHSEYTLKSDI